jgi:colanic acid/amylovoran biosynthesis glycosyltransferase
MGIGNKKFIRSRPSPSIAYLNQVFPDLTQTFVYREVLALRAREIPVRTFSVWRPDPANLSAETIPLRDETFYIFPLSWFSMIRAHLKYITSRTLRYLGTLVFLLTRPGEPLRNRWRSLMHFVYGLVAIREMERLKIEHIHVHFAWSASSIALIAQRLLGIPFSISLHSKEIYSDRLLLADKVRDSKFIVTISEYNQRFLNELFPEGELEDKIHIVHCGLDPDIFRASPKPQQNDAEFVIVGVAQLVPRKGFHVLIEACHHLASRGMPFRCHIFGEGEERNQLENLIEQYNLDEQVLMPGWIQQEELHQRLNQADVFALPCIRDKSGDQDGIPVVLMEAMAMELAVVSTHISGIPELIEHGRNGLLIDPGDVSALADALHLLKNNPELRLRLGKAGRETVIKEFNIHRTAEQMAMLFAKRA